MGPAIVLTLSRMAPIEELLPAGFGGRVNGVVTDMAGLLGLIGGVEPGRVNGVVTDMAGLFGFRGFAAGGLTFGGRPACG